MSRWKLLGAVCKIWSLIIIGLIIPFLLGEAFGTSESDEGFRNFAEVMTFIFFPVGVLSGLIIGLFYKGWGGFLSVLSLIGLFTLRSDLLSSWYFTLAIAPPALMLIVLWIMRPKMTEGR